MDLSIVIVNWNTEKLLMNCINSIKNETRNISYEIIVYDNNSHDGSIRYIEEIYDDIIIIKGKENLGFSKANNRAVEVANGKYILLLNPDTIIIENSIEKTFEFMKKIKNENALVGCKLLNKDLSIQLSAACFPTLYNYTIGKTSDIEMNSYTHECDWIMGAFMMLSKDLYKRVNGFEEVYFMYCEDMDLCYKINKNLGQVYFFNDAKTIHLYNQSGEKKWKGNREKELKKSTFIFLEKNIRNIVNRNMLKFIYNSKYLIKKYLMK